MRWSFAWIAVISSLVVEPALAFSLRTHVFVADRILDDAKDCSLEVGLAKPYALDPVVCAALASHPAHFRGGVLGPDVFPDFVVGQVTTHPGVEEGWESGMWLRHVLASADPGDAAQVAFSFGFMVHGSSDVFAHSYVNGYAGDIFDVSDETRVEERHFRLEKFLEKHTPSSGLLDASTVKVPARFVSKALVFDSEVQGQYLKSAYAPHLLAIALDRNVAREANVGYTKLRDLVFDLITEYYKLQYGLIEKGNAAKLSLEGAKRALDVANAQHQIEEEATRLAKKGLEEILRTIERNPEAITFQLKVIEEQLKLAADLARQAAELDRQIAALQDRMRDARDQAAGAVCDLISERACSTVCPDFVPGCKEVCKTVNRVSDACHAARRLVSDIEGAVARAHHELNQTVARRAAAVKDSAAAELEVHRLRIALEAAHAARAGAEGAVQIHEKYLEAKRQVLDEAAKTVAAAEKIYNEIMAELKRITDVFDGLNELAKRLDPLKGLLDNLVIGIERATDAYIEASLKGGIAALNADANVLAAYREWLDCWGSAYLGVPWQAGQAYCEVAKDAQRIREKLQNEIDDIKGRLPAPLPDLLRAYDKFREGAMGLAKATALKSGAAFTAFITGDPNLPRFIALLADPSKANRDGLNDAFKSASNPAGKDLLTFPDVASMIEKDAHIASGSLDPERFEALRAAIVLSKLSVLDYRALNRMYLDEGGGENSSYADGQPLYPDTRRLESAIAEGVRSLDGNHQWQAYGIPYPRKDSAAEPLEPLKRHFGYTPFDERPHGMRLFADPTARSAVFKKIFPKPFVGEVNELLSNHRLNPFMTCDAVPYPLTVGDDGVACRSDKRCLSWWRVRNWLPKIADELTCDR